MTAEITCPHCNWLLVVEPGDPAREITCWNCGGEFVTLAAAGPDPDPLPAEEPPAEPPPAVRPARSRAAWAVAAVAVIAAGAAAGFAWVNVKWATEAERAAGQARAERDAAEEKAEAAARELDAVRKDVEAARQETAAARQEAAKALALSPGDEVGVIPRDIPADVREAATATLRKFGEAAVPLFRKALADARAELDRLKAGKRSPGGNWAAIRTHEQRAMAAQRGLSAWEGDDLDFFAPNLTTPADRGAVGRIAGGRVRVTRVIGRDAAVVEYPVGTARPATAVVTGLGGDRLAAGQTAELADVLVVAGSVTVGRDTYPRLAVFTASKR